MYTRLRKPSLIAAGVISILAAAQASAAETQLEEIIVTARQREERLQDVPVTVQAFGSTEIQSAGIERPTDFINLTAGVAQVQTAEAGDLQVTIRGINTGRDAETNFALVVDGVLQTNPNALNQELANVTQIEVLKGPQGALYGRNAVAGAMIITTRKPGDSFEFDVGAGYGTENSYKGNFYVAGPLTENTSGAIGAYIRSTDGHWENSLLGCDDCVDFFEEYGVTGRLVTRLGETGEVDIKAKYSKLDAGAINFNASLALQDAANLGFGDVFWEDPNKHPFVYINNVKPENEQENINLSIKADFEVGANTLTTVVAYNDQTNYFLTDGTSAAFFLYSLTESCIQSNAARAADTPLPPPFFYSNTTGFFVDSFLPPYGPTTCDGYQYQQRDQKDASIELRLTSPGDQAFRWVAGLYAADIERRVVVSQGSDSGQGFLKQALVRTGGPNPTDLLYDDTFNSAVVAGFGQLAYDVTEDVEVALALRYDREEREVDNNVPKLPPQTPGFFGTNDFINPAYVQDPTLTAIPGRSRTFSQMQPKLSVNWKATDQVSFFASYGYGFRSGGFNSTGVNATVELFYSGLCLGDQNFTDPNLPLFLPPCTGDNRSLQNVNDDFEKEVSKAFEAGFKATLLDGSLSVNGAVFQTDLENMQFFNFFAGPFGLLRVVTNAEEASISGFELDARWRATEWLTLFAGYGYTDTEIDRYDGRPYTKGNKIPYAPEYTGNAGIDISVPVGGGDWVVNARLDGTFMGETWFSTVQDDKVPNLFTAIDSNGDGVADQTFGQGEFSKQKRDSYATMNARLGISNGTWTVTAWGRNITDEDYLQEIIPAPEFGGSFIHDSPGDSYGLDVKYSFR
ncbi:MAG: TonB-dependent receptor [Steroidobacteraceae bacterium]|jgi:iron complex outermembrane receptor protein|nr:TonB-dependent receptor [Steroidobacteraceae bacterium]